MFSFYIISLHAGVSGTEFRSNQAIPHSAFVDAVNDYVADSETDEEGSIHASQPLLIPLT